MVLRSRGHESIWDALDGHLDLVGSRAESEEGVVPYWKSLVEFHTIGLIVRREYYGWGLGVSGG